MATATPASFLSELARLWGHGTVNLSGLAQQLCCAIDERIRVVIPGGPAIPSIFEIADPSRSPTLPASSFPQGQRIYVRSLDAFFYYLDFPAPDSPPPADGITVLITSQGGTTRYIREL